ncbi:hypothetical protein BASA61_009945 [Batrachochytrium salamandrivorans]|nr:hypothetical protein BASA61_009945 [Batrachochytrium salamandrivorans]
MPTTRQCCGFIFAIKVLVAFLIAVGGIGYQAYIVYRLYGPGLVLPPVSFPPPTSVDASRCYHNAANGKSRLEPPPGIFWLGFSLNWNSEVPSAFNSKLGLKPAIFNSFVKINATDFENDIITWNAQQAGQVGAMLELTLMPTVPVETIPTTLLWDYAVLMRRINSAYGVPVLLRFGHEMNGPWMEGFGMRPREYIQAFTTLASYVRTNTNMTAMLWSPNVGNSYPFGAVAGQAPTPAVGTPNFLALDTNKDGVLNNLDDPYGPYYPGDQWVDWVGVSVYNYRYDANHQVSTVVLDDLSVPGETSLTGADPIHNFYQRFVIDTKKPFILSETGSAYQTGGGQEPTHPLPRLIAAVWFEEAKAEVDGSLNGALTWRDFRVSSNTTVRNAFVSDLNALGNQLDWAGSLKVSCDGSVAISP